ncbi:MAG: CDP-alcohol phosphatidyltransferase family protein, partial [Terriglobales bacterium]
PFYMFRIADEAKAADIQRFLFWSNYKGSTDLFTRYVYPPLVWLLVRPLARARIHPNLVTLVSIALTFGAVPFFAAGHWLVGFLMAYGMSVLDSVDGKLARLTFTDSRLGNFLDHGLDMIHPPIWYVAWAYGLGLSAEGWNSPLGYATVAIIVFYVLDRLILKIYPRYFQRGFHTHSKLDATVRSFIARRNINMPVFLLGCVFGLAREAFYLIAAWHIATAAYHGIRTFWIIGVQKAHRDPNAKPAHVDADLD